MEHINVNLGIITSQGGHLLQIVQLHKFIRKYRHFWITFKGKDTQYYLKKEKKYYAFFPESRNFINLIKNLFLAASIFVKERPNILISTGAGITLPFFLVGKYIFRTKLIFIEPHDFIAYPTITGKILYYFCDLFLVQHEIQLKWFNKAKFWGSLL